MSDQFTIIESFHPDIRELYPSPFIQASPMPISRRLFVCKRPFGMDWYPVVRQTVDHVFYFIHQEPTIKDRPLLYFGATDVLIMGSGSIQRYKKYWKHAFSSTEIDTSEFDDCVEFLIREHEDRLIYASCASVAEKHLPVLFESLRLGRSGFVSIPAHPPSLSEQLVRELCEISTKDSLDSYMDQPRICELICRDGGIHLQIYGGFGDRELEIYMHYRPDLVSLEADSIEG